MHDNGAANRETVQKPVIEKIHSRDIAIIGIDAVLPCADNPELFWKNVSSGKVCIRDIPGRRKRDVSGYLELLGSTPSMNGFETAGYLDQIDLFDNSFFSISPKEASVMDPNQRLMLEVAYHAAEDAGYGGKKLSGSKTGVYIGYSYEADYKRMVSVVHPDQLQLAPLGNISSLVANRISYALNLKGPSMLVDTVCSSSMVAVHLACSALRNGECELAIAGGIQIYTTPIRQVELGIESANSEIRAFDEYADGTCGGEGVVAFLLKPRYKALRDKDNIYAVIKGTAVNQDGTSNGLSAPNPEAQKEVIVSAWKDAGIDPSEISYIECHGTGTRLGDPIEISGIQKAFEAYTSEKQFCAISAVKPNIGHLDAAAGAAGLLKAVLALRHRQIPPLVNFMLPSSHIDFMNSPFHVSDTLAEWETNGSKRLCGVSSFGLGGTNCHVVVEEYPQQTCRAGGTEARAHILTLSAKEKGLLAALANSFYDYLCKNEDINLGDICYTANTGRGHYGCRLAFVARYTDQLKSQLKIVCQYGLKANLEQGIYCAIPDAGEANRQQRDKLSLLNIEANERLICYKNTKTKDLECLGEICRLYADGADIDWDLFYMGDDYNKISLPLYPYKRNRCWVEKENRQASDGLQRMFHTTAWIRKELEQAQNGINDWPVILVKSDNDASGELVQRLSKQGRKVIEFNLGESFTNIGQSNYAITGDMEDFKRLFEDIKEQGWSGATIIMETLWYFESGGMSELETRLRQGVFTFLQLAKAVLDSQAFKTELIILSKNTFRVTGRETAVYPENAALAGLGKVYNLENNFQKCRFIDYDENTAIDALINEINVGYTFHNTAYRDGCRYIEELRETGHERRNNGTIAIRSSGVYVITGGTGGLGLEMACFLASQNSVNIALINRTPMPARECWDDILEKSCDEELAGKIKKLNDIEEMGAVVECFSADVSDEKALEEVLRQLRIKYGRINGIIHSAGVGAGLQGKTIASDDAQSFDLVMRPKVQGTWILDRLTRIDNPDFFVVFTSPIVLIGGMGSGSYTAANSYLNEFARYRRSMGLKTVAMGWAPWEETLRSKKIAFKSSRQMFMVLSTNEIVRSFVALIDSSQEVVYVGRLNYESEVFGLRQLFPFVLSREIEYKLDNGSDLYNSGLYLSGSKKVKLKGKPDDNYSANELLTAQIFKDFLGYDELNSSDNFFELGGDSIIALEIVNSINKIKGTCINVVSLLKNPTVAGFAAVLDTACEYSSIIYPPIEPAPEKEYYHVSPEQKRTYLLSQLEGVSVTYNMPQVLVLEGDIDGDRIEDTFRKLVARHEIFRVSFHVVNGDIYQKVHPQAQFSMTRLMVGGNDLDDMVKSQIYPFELTVCPLLRVVLIEATAGRYILAIDMHHTISDGMSKGILVDEFISLYNGLKLKEPAISYKDYAEWKHTQMEADWYRKQEEYWLKTLQGAAGDTVLPTDYPRPAVQCFEGETLEFRIGQEQTRSIRKLCHESNSTMFTILLSAYIILLSKYSGNDDITVGTILSGRTHPSLDNVLGIFTKFHALRVCVDRKKTCSLFMEDVKTRVHELYENQDYNLEQLNTRLNAGAGHKKDGFYNTMFILQNMGVSEMSIDGITISPYKLKNKTARLDLTVEAEEQGDEVKLGIEFCTKLFKPQTIQKLFEEYMVVLNAIVKDRETIIEEIKLDNEVLVLDKSIVDLDFDLF